MKCGKKEIPFDMILYDKNTSNKIDIALKVIEEVSKLIKVDILLTDSWYASKEVIKFARDKNILFIDSLKKNRVIYPEKKNNYEKIQIKELHFI
ncbi:MAG: transposase [Clostridiales bacterium]